MTPSYGEDAGSIPVVGSNCTECNSPILGYGKKFCGSTCSARANNRKRGQVKAKPCKNCGASVASWRTYCNKACEANHRHVELIDSWLAGFDSGLDTNGTVKKFVKRWLRETLGDYCCLCGWAETNPVTGNVPVVADHVDGDWRNNRPENLRLLCPNCDSLQPTYQALNTGNGRTQRVPYDKSRNLRTKEILQDAGSIPA